MLFYIIIVFCIMEYLGMQYVYECAVLKKKRFRSMDFHNCS